MFSVATIIILSSPKCLNLLSSFSVHFLLPNVLCLIQEGAMSWFFFCSEAACFGAPFWGVPSLGHFLTYSSCTFSALPEEMGWSPKLCREVSLHSPLHLSRSAVNPDLPTLTNTHQQLPAPGNHGYSTCPVLSKPRCPSSCA